MTARIGDVIEQAARVFRKEWLQADRECDAGNRVRRGLSAIVDAGLLTEPRAREEIAEALSVPDVHHPDHCDCGQPICGGTHDAEGEDCFCEAETCDGLEQQTDAMLALLDQPPARDVEAEARDEAARRAERIPRGRLEFRDGAISGFIAGAKWATGGAR